MNLANLRAKSQIIKLIRRFFDERGYTEMHTPRLVGLPGQEPYLEPFWTTVNSPNVECETLAPCDAVARTVDLPANTEASEWCRVAGHVQNVNPQREVACADGEHCFSAGLITSPEYMMKRLLAAGLDRIYDLGSCFRNNEPWDGTHDPEFLMLEWYRKNAELDALMDETEEMVKWVAEEWMKQTSDSASEASLRRNVWSRVEPAVTPSDAPFRRLTVEDAWREYAGIELAPLLENRDAMAEVCRAHEQTVNDADTWDDLYFKIFLSEIEPQLTTEARSSKLESSGSNIPASRFQLPATFLYRYPLSMAALARPSKDDPRWADRVELYMGGIELANGFAELEDAAVQRKRFEEERELRASLGKKTWPLDEKFLAAIPSMENAVGMAFGVDRLVMLLVGTNSINDVLPSSARERFIV